MLKALFLLLSEISWAQRLITHWRFAWRMASRFIAGESQADAISVVKTLNEQSLNATVDFLGENITNREESILAANEVCSMLEQLTLHDARSNVSVKLSQMGLMLDIDLCRDNLKRILLTAQEMGNFVRIDMEDSSLTEPTINMYIWAREQGFENVGIVLQSYLYRTADDLTKLGIFGARVRLCKGAYREPKEIAFQDKSKVDESFDRLSKKLFENVMTEGTPCISDDGRIPPIPAIATHDPKRIAYALTQAERMGIPKDAFEIQMLYGIRRDLQQQLSAQGYPVRVYVPYGSHWYPYFMRRLAERPANLWFFVSSLFKK